jgi:DNA-binding transcriptional LysR family regulator
VLEAEQRWTVTNMSTSIGAVSRGHGFAWLPQDKIRTELEDGSLEILPLRGGRERIAQLYLIFADRDAAGPGVLRLAEIVREEVQQACRSEKKAARPQ